jgi:broad specificity phosphatase PhoE
MGRPPAYLFVVRHGYRLDAADKQWHLTSPTPYDPPLTYSGWQQAKSLGARIASIIRERVQEDERSASHETVPSVKRKRKRYEVALHSSPFLRCIQTSIAISAGLAQDSTPFESPSPSQVTPPTPVPTTDGRPKPIVVTDIRPAATIRKSVLRLDAFLGEWLSPSYFEFITPPPESVMMLASAKADLLRREDYTHYPNFVSHNHSSSQGQLWSPIVRESSASPFGTGQKEEFGSTTDSATSPATASSASGRRDHDARVEKAGYVSPVPHYAISSNNNIPAGYVSHARDACVMVDYQWHSTRSLLDWGDGGSFPEEWAAMHKRFRAGAQSLVDWYSTADRPTRPVTKSVRSEPSDDSNDEDVDIESIVIMVSHGAGCNALIGAITHQPVLMDVGMASLTMAVRKPSTEISGALKGSETTLPVHELYDLKLFANTDHLRSPTDTPTNSRAPAMLSPSDGIRGRHASFSTSTSRPPWNDGPGRNSSPASAGLGGFRQGLKNDSPVPRLSFAVSTGGITVGSGVTSFAATRPSNLVRGLWSPIADEDEEDDSPVLNFGNHGKKAAPTGPPAPTPTPAPEPKSTPSNVPQTTNGSTVLDRLASGGSGQPAERSPKPDREQLGAGTGGLWGTPRPPDDADRFRDVTASKRRWTVTERP